MARVPFIVPRGLSREETAAWLLEAVTAARKAAGRGEERAPDGDEGEADAAGHIENDA